MIAKPYSATVSQCPVFERKFRREVLHGLPPFFFYTGAMTKKDAPEHISQSLAKLEKIIEWFDEQEQVDVQEGLAKVREGAGLVKELRARLKTVENEFEELKKDLDEETA